MPKIGLPSYPLSGLFGIAKPSGPTSMAVVNEVKLLLSRSQLFVDSEKLEKTRSDKPKLRRKARKGGIKIGQGGTLDPLADGVLVVGVGKGTKKLTEFLDCTKEYRATCLIGCETDTYDSQGTRVRLAPWKHLNQEQVQSALVKFTGEIEQTPPIFSALKMDGIPLYEYARRGIPLPRSIKSRKVVVHSLELVEWKGSNHTYRWPEKCISEQEKKALNVTLASTGDSAILQDDLEVQGICDIPPAFVLKMKVSGGTYVRSIVHDLCLALGSAGHVVTLTRCRQGRFVLGDKEENDLVCIPWKIFQQALTDPGEADEIGRVSWEREVLKRLEVVE